jgi:hypothetical protein
MECALDNMPILLSFLFAQRHPFFPAVIVRIALVRKHVINAICSGNIDVFRGTEINLESASYAAGALGAREKHDVSNGTFGTQSKARPGANSQNLQAEVVTQR